MPKILNRVGITNNKQHDEKKVFTSQGDCDQSYVRSHELVLRTEQFCSHRREILQGEPPLVDTKEWHVKPLLCFL